MKSVNKTPFRIMGAFVCPHCLKDNLCICPTCKKHYDSVDLGNYKFCQYTPDGNNFICSYCNEGFSPDESLEIEYQQYKQRKDESNILRAE